MLQRIESDITSRLPGTGFLFVFHVLMLLVNLLQFELYRSKLRPEVISAARRRKGPIMTSSFDSWAYVPLSAPLPCLVYLVLLTSFTVLKTDRTLFRPVGCTTDRT